MKTNSELPDDVLQLLHANRKIDAIKLLRTHHRLDLKEAKDVVDAYMAKNPQLIRRSSPASETGVSRFIFILIIIAVLYALYRYTG